MAGTSEHGKAFIRPQRKAHLLVIEARFHDGLSDALLDGATSALKEAGATWDVVTVPGSLEIPAVISSRWTAPPRAARPMTASSRSAPSSAAIPIISTSSPTNPRAR
jgi:hypothetical protein